MDNLLKAYKILDSINDYNDQNEIKEKAKEAYELDNGCIEAAIILSKFESSFIEKERILLTTINSQKTDDNKAILELASVYYEQGMFKKALSLLEKVNDAKSIKYRLMIIYAYFEDGRINDYYFNNTDINDDIDFIRMSFTYMIYKFKIHDLDDAKKIYQEINIKNPYIIKIVNGEEVDENDTSVKEAYKVLKNNSLLLNGCPYIFNNLESVC